MDDVSRINISGSTDQTWGSKTHLPLLKISVVIGSVALAIFAVITIAKNPMIVPFSIHPTILITGIVVIIALVCFILFKGKTPHKDVEYHPIPKWLELDDFYEVDSLVENDKPLDGWRRYNYLKLQQYEHASTVFNELKQAADAGESQAQFKLARLYEKGIGCKADIATAFKILKQAEASGNKDVLVKLGVYYCHLENNKEKAIELWTIAAEGKNAHPFAKTLLAKHYKEKFKEDITNKELAKKIVTYHSQAATHPSGVGYASAGILNVWYTQMAMTFSIKDNYNELHQMIAKPDGVDLLDSSSINCILLIQAEDLPLEGDFEKLKSKMQEESDKYRGVNQLYLTQYEALLKRTTF